MAIHRLAARTRGGTLSSLVYRLSAVPCICSLIGTALCVLTLAAASAQPLALRPDSLQVSAGVPGFWDPRRRPERPDLSHVSLIRFLTEIDFPPFDFAGSDGNPAGFNVDLARLICEDLKVSCTVQMRRFDTLLAALGENRGDAVIASVAPTPLLRQRVDFSDPYYRSPARFVALRDAAPAAVAPERLEGKKIGVVSGEAEARGYPNADAAREALRRREVDLLFGDGIGLAFWLNGTDSANCCKFVGGPFTESRYFGDGIGIAVKRGNDTMRLALNWALFRLWEQGRFTDLWLRYFPISPF